MHFHIPKFLWKLFWKRKNKQNKTRKKTPKPQQIHKKRRTNPQLEEKDVVPLTPLELCQLSSNKTAEKLKECISRKVYPGKEAEFFVEIARKRHWNIFQVSVKNCLRLRHCSVLKASVWILVIISLLRFIVHWNSCMRSLILKAFLTFSPSAIIWHFPHLITYKTWHHVSLLARTSSNFRFLPT